MDPKVNENCLQVSNYEGKSTHLLNLMLWIPLCLFTESSKRVTDETHKDSGEHVSDNELGIYWKIDLQYVN